MSLKDLFVGKKKENPSRPPEQEHPVQELSPEQLRALTLEMSCGMLPTCSFPDGIWYLY